MSFEENISGALQLAAVADDFICFYTDSRISCQDVTNYSTVLVVEGTIDMNNVVATDTYLV